MPASTPQPASKENNDRALTAETFMTLLRIGAGVRWRRACQQCRNEFWATEIGKGTLFFRLCVAVAVRLFIRRVTWFVIFRQFQYWPERDKNGAVRFAWKRPGRRTCAARQ